MLTNWCKPPSADLWSITDQEGTLGNRLAILTATTQTMEPYEVALLGTDGSADKVRRVLYQLTDHFPELQLLDLGNLRKPRPDFAIPLLAELLDARIVPVWIGEKTAVTTAMVRAYQHVERTVSVGALHPAAGFEAGVADTVLTAANRYTAMGYQAHLTPLTRLEALREKGADTLRLGEMRTQLVQAEPFLRNLDLLGVDAGVVREADLPAQTVRGGVGLTLEELCQAAFYAGAGDRLSGFGIAGWDPAADRDGRSARALAAVVWYFLDGVSRRQGDFPVGKQHMTEYVVSTAEGGTELTFWKSERSGRWWVEVTDHRETPAVKHLLACNYADYTELVNGTITPFLLRLLGRFA